MVSSMIRVRQKRLNGTSDTDSSTVKLIEKLQADCVLLRRAFNDRVQSVMFHYRWNSHLMNITDISANYRNCRIQ